MKRSEEKVFRNGSLIALGITAVLWLGGCQIDVSGGFGTKLFYPDSFGNKQLGDPRKPMYEGSGYTERRTTGGEVSSSGGVWKAAQDIVHQVSSVPVLSEKETAQAQKPAQ